MWKKACCGDCHSNSNYKSCSDNTSFNTSSDNSSIQDKNNKSEQWTKKVTDNKRRAEAWKTFEKKYDKWIKKRRVRGRYARLQIAW